MTNSLKEGGGETDPLPAVQHWSKKPQKENRISYHKIPASV